MTRHVIETGDQPDSEAERVIGQGLALFNEQASGLNDRRALTVLVRDPDTQAVLGGLIGKTSLGMAFLELFHLPDALRGTGIGTQLLHTFEAQARARGCRTAVLYTLSFQAPGFYEKNGWVRFGEFPCEPAGSRRIFLVKQL